MEPIRICTFGEFSLQFGHSIVSDSSNRSRKVWTLIAYLVLHRNQVISPPKLIELLWGNDSSNPENALRITIHRARNILDSLFENAGHTLILQKEGGYAWNSAAAIEIDCERFDALCHSSVESGKQRIDEAAEALSLYRGEFLPRQSSEIWVIPMGTHYHNRYLSITQEVSSLLAEQKRYEEAIVICRRAIASEPYHEPLHQILIRLLASTNRHKEAAELYSALSKRLFDDFGIRPSEETRNIYRACVHSPEDRTLLMDEIIEHLQEHEAPPGAMQCDYDYFKVLCYAESRAMERSGSATHIALLSLVGPSDKPLTNRSIHRIMDQLGEQLRLNLRRGDVISRCSVSQYIIMLPQANYEDSGMVCRRVIGAFRRAHPHVTAAVNYMVQPLTSGFCAPYSASV